MSEAADVADGVKIQYEVMTMTKKHFIEMADTLKAFFETNAGAEMDVMTRNVLINHLADFCQSQNPNFNRERWLGYIAGTNGKNGGAR